MSQLDGFTDVYIECAIWASTPVSAARLQESAQAVVDAYAARNALIRDALEQGWTQRAVADAVGLSAGRLGQLALELGRSVRQWVPNDAE